MNQDQLSGILSDWNKIEADVLTGIHTDYGKSKNIQDILDIIHDLQNEANTVTPLRELFNLHVTNKQNPHEVTVSITDLDILNTMYNLYIEKFGIGMSFSDFGYALINIKRFATNADVDAHINQDSIMNIGVMEHIVDVHNVSPLAHADLFRYKLPGTPLSLPPSVVYDPNISLASMFVVNRPCPINYHDINGRVKTAPNNILPVDYSYGIPSAPIFGPHYNSLLNSRRVTDASLHGATNNLNSDLLIITPSNDTAFLLLQESLTNTTHGFSDPVQEELTGVNNYSIYVYPIDRSQLSIDVIVDGSEIIETVLFDCNTVSTQRTGSMEKVFPDMLELPNGWFRCVISFDATGHNITSFEVNVMDKIDPVNNYNTIYVGTNCNAMGFWQHQITKTVLPTPPIFTDNSVASVLGTIVQQNFTDAFNPTHGSIVIRYISPLSEIFGTDSAIMRLGDNTDPAHLKTTISFGTNEFSPKRNRIVSYNMSNDIMETLDSDPYDPSNPTSVKRIAFTYSLGYQGYGFTNQSPLVFETSADDALSQMNTFFTSVYTGEPIYYGTKILQLPEQIIGIDTTDEGSMLIVGTLANSSQYRISNDVTILELGYDSTSNKYLEGYLINFRYYSVFSSDMNLEFLLDQYIPTK